MSYNRAYERNRRYEKMHKNHYGSYYIPASYYDEFKGCYVRYYKLRAKKYKISREKSIRRYIKNLPEDSSFPQHGTYRKIICRYWW